MFALDFLIRISSRVVYFSSGGRVYKDSASLHLETEALYEKCPYGLSKIALEEHIRNETLLLGKKCLVIRPSNPYGLYQYNKNNQGLIAVALNKIINGEPIEVWGDGDEVRDSIYIDDFIDIFMRLIMRDKLKYNTYNVSSGVGASTLDVINSISNVLSFRVDILFKKVDFNFIKYNVIFNDRVINEVNDQDFPNINSGIKSFLS